MTQADRFKAAQSILHGTQFPYDAPDSWWNGDGDVPPPEVVSSFSYKAARGIIADLTDRRDIKQGFTGVDEDVRKEIITAIANIIEVAHGA